MLITSCSGHFLIFRFYPFVIMAGNSLVRMFKRLPNPVYIYFEKENIHTSDEKSDLLMSLYMGIYEEEIVNLGSNVAWGIRKYAERGIVKGGFCYGYYNDKERTWSINEEEANVVKQIYSAALKGKSYGAIAEELTNNKIPSPGGKALITSISFLMKILI